MPHTDFHGVCKQGLLTTIVLILGRIDANLMYNYYPPLLSHHLSPVLGTHIYTTLTDFWNAFTIFSKALYQNFIKERMSLDLVNIAF